MAAPVIIGDRVRIVTGPCEGRVGVVRRTQRQRTGEQKAIFWVEVWPGETHAFFRDEFVWDGHLHDESAAQVSRKAGGDAP